MSGYRDVAVRNARTEFQPPKLYEWTATLDEGVNLTTGEPWRGHRVKYREQGGWFWRSFLLSKDDGTAPTETEVLQAINACAEKP